MNSVALSVSTPMPRVLLADTNRWSLSSRLALALADAGCSVAGICPMPGHALQKASPVQAVFHYSGFRPLESLRSAIAAFQPDIVIPCCDRSVRHLHELHARMPGSPLAALVERSLGDPGGYPVVASRYELLALARAEGIAVPRTEKILDAQQLRSQMPEYAFPFVLKADGTWGGGGVKIVSSPDETESALAQLARVFRLQRALKRLVVNRDRFWLRPWWNRSSHQLVAQSYIHGRPANCAVLSWKGQVLGGISVEVVSSEGATGPASVVRVIDNREMMFAAERIAARLGVSGLFGLDFVIEEGSGTAFLIEMNPRATPLCHLRLGPGRDMPGALWGQLASQAPPMSPPVTENPLIAYFPQACTGDPEMLKSSFLDIPQEEPALLEELRNPWPDRTLLFRIFTRISAKPAAAGRNNTQAGDFPASEAYCPCHSVNEKSVSEDPGGKHLGSRQES